jgi:mRNA-degrading endonuclease RelE of RelBE toxin-antitoxin system
MVSKRTKKLFKKKKSLLTKILAIVRSFDMYGKDIVLTYKGDDKYRTHIGGFASIMVGVVILVYIVFLFQVMFTKGDTNYSKTSLYNDLVNNEEILHPAKDKFDFAFSFTASGVDYLSDPTYFSFEINQVEQTWTTSGATPTTNRVKTPISYTKWGYEYFNHDKLSDVSRLGINDYYWPTNDEYSVAGTFYSKVFNYIEVRLSKCSGGGCKTNAEIETIMKQARFSMAIENTVIDLKDFSEPIQHIIDDGFFWELVPGFRKKTDILIRKNEAEFEDGYVQLGFSEQHKFFQVVNSNDYFESESSSGDVLSIYFNYDKESDIYNRQIFSFAELLGQVGGFYGSLIAIGSILIFIFSERLFAASILKKIYQIDAWQEKEMLSDKKDSIQIWDKE